MRIKKVRIKGIRIKKVNTKRRKEETKGFLKASITVEAAYIVPIILGIIFAVIIASFYFYDAVTAKAVLDKNVVRLKNVLIHPLEEEGYYYNYSAINERFLYSFSEDYRQQEDMGREQIKKELEASLMLLHIQNIDMRIKKKELTASIELYYGMALPGVCYLPFFRRVRKVSADISIYNQADFARIVTMIDKT